MILNQLNMHGVEPDEEVMKQVNRLSQEFRDKLDEVGLIETQDKSIFNLDNFLGYVLEKQEERYKSGQIAESTYQKLTYIQTHFLNHMTLKRTKTIVFCGGSRTLPPQLQRMSTNKSTSSVKFCHWPCRGTAPT